MAILKEPCGVERRDGPHCTWYCVLEAGHDGKHEDNEGVKFSRVPFKAQFREAIGEFLRERGYTEDGARALAAALVKWLDERQLVP